MDALPEDPFPALPPIALPALDKRRIKDALERESWSYSVDSDGDIGGMWDSNWFFFFVMGKNEEVLNIRANWRGRLADQDRPALLEICNDWNRDKIWPKTYVGRDDDGFVRVSAEVSVDHEHGLTDEQLSQQILCAISTSTEFFQTLDQAYPAAVAD